MRAAQFLARYPNADPFNRTNSDHPESTLPLALSRGVFLRCNIAADLTLNCSLRVELEPEVAYFPAFTAPLKQESTKVVCFFNSVVPVPDTSGNPWCGRGSTESAPRSVRRTAHGGGTSSLGLA